MIWGSFEELREWVADADDLRVCAIQVPWNREFMRLLVATLDELA